MAVESPPEVISEPMDMGNAISRAVEIQGPEEFFFVNSDRFSDANLQVGTTISTDEFASALREIGHGEFRVFELEGFAGLMDRFGQVHITPSPTTVGPMQPWRGSRQPSSIDREITVWDVLRDRQDDHGVRLELRWDGSGWGARFVPNESTDRSSSRRTKRVHRQLLYEALNAALALLAQADDEAARGTEP